MAYEGACAIVNDPGDKGRRDGAGIAPAIAPLSSLVSKKQMVTPHIRANSLEWDMKPGAPFAIAQQTHIRAQLWLPV